MAGDRLEPEMHEIDMFEHGWAEGNALLITTGLGPCVGVALYSRRLKRGFMAHLVNPAQNRRDTDAFFDLVRGSMEGKTSGLRAWLRGASPDEPLSPRVPEVGSEADRFCIVSKIGELGVRGVDVAWNDNPAIAVDMQLDCWTGRFLEDVTNVDPSDR